MNWTTSQDGIQDIQRRALSPRRRHPRTYLSICLLRYSRLAKLVPVHICAFCITMSANCRQYQRSYFLGTDFLTCRDCGAVLVPGMPDVNSPT